MGDGLQFDSWRVKNYYFAFSSWNKHPDTKVTEQWSMVGLMFYKCYKSMLNSSCSANSCGVD